MKVLLSIQDILAHYTLYRMRVPDVHLAHDTIYLIYSDKCSFCHEFLSKNPKLLALLDRPVLSGLRFKSACITSDPNRMMQALLASRFYAMEIENEPTLDLPSMAWATRLYPIDIDRPLEELVKDLMEEVWEEVLSREKRSKILSILKRPTTATTGLLRPGLPLRPEELPADMTLFAPAENVVELAKRDALHLLARGWSLREVIFYIRERYRLEVSRYQIYRWLKEEGFENVKDLRQKVRELGIDNLRRHR